MKNIEKISNSIACPNCKTTMEIFRVKKYSGQWPSVIIGTGIFCTLFFIGPIAGVPMILYGAYMFTTEDVISHCPNCGHYFKVWLNKEESA
jgi:hypothetical protein